MKSVPLILSIAGVIALSGTKTAALDLAVAGFYSPGLVTGDVAEVTEISTGGFKGRVSLNVYRGLNLALGFGYNDFVYREDKYTIPDYVLVLSIPMFLATFGADYSFSTGSLRPYVGGGVGLARESAKAGVHTVTDWYRGLYAEGGARYFFGESWAVEVGPRYTYLFDEPVVAYDDWESRDFVRSEDRSQLLEFLFGASYHF